MCAFVSRPGIACLGNLGIGNHDQHDSLVFSVAHFRKFVFRTAKTQGTVGEQFGPGGSW